VGYKKKIIKQVSLLLSVFILISCDLDKSRRDFFKTDFYKDRYEQLELNIEKKNERDTNTKIDLYYGHSLQVVSNFYFRVSDVTGNSNGVVFDVYYNYDNIYINDEIFIEDYISELNVSHLLLLNEKLFYFDGYTLNRYDLELNFERSIIIKTYDGTMSEYRSGIYYNNGIFLVTIDSEYIITYTKIKEAFTNEISIEESFLLKGIFNSEKYHILYGRSTSNISDNIQTLIVISESRFYCLINDVYATIDLEEKTMEFPKYPNFDGKVDEGYFIGHDEPDWHGIVFSVYNLLTLEEKYSLNLVGLPTPGPFNSEPSIPFSNIKQIVYTNSGAYLFQEFHKNVGVFDYVYKICVIYIENDNVKVYSFSEQSTFAGIYYKNNLPYAEIDCNSYNSKGEYTTKGKPVFKSFLLA
jgi:hypothetical protein